MPRSSKVCVCGCGEPVAKGRSKYASSRCARRTWKKAEKVKKAADPKRQTPKGAPQVGEERRSATGYWRVYQPDHPLAGRDGWAGINRVDMYDYHEGKCPCFATGQLGEWKDARVMKITLSDGNRDLQVVCNWHGRVIAFGEWLSAQTPGDDMRGVLAGLNLLMKRPCPANDQPNNTVVRGVDSSP